MWGIHQNFYLALIGELEKQLFIKKKLFRVGQQKSKNFKIYNVVFFSENKEKHLQISLFYTSVPKILIIWFTVPDI